MSLLLSDFTNTSELNDVQKVHHLVENLRPRFTQNKSIAQVNIQSLIEQLNENAQLKNEISNTFKNILLNTSLIDLFTESGIHTSEGFFKELYAKISHKILPDVVNQKSLKDLLLKWFYDNNDYNWLNQISDAVFNQFIKIIWDELCSDEALALKLKNELIECIGIVSYRLSSIGLENDISSRLGIKSFKQNPFVYQNQITNNLLENFEKHSIDSTQNESLFNDLQHEIQNCLSTIDQIKHNRKEFGASIALTFQLTRCLQLSNRLKLLLTFINPKHLSLINHTGNFIKYTVWNECNKNSIRNHFNGNINLLALQVTDNAHKTGEHYITSSRKEYWKMLGSASGGGLIVGFLSFFKLLIYYAHFPLFGTAFWYSMNYSFGFIAIHLNHFTLATKQPAMTASTIAKSLDNNDGSGINFSSLADLVVRLSRSQLIAFIGNAVVAFPVAFGIAAIYYLITGENVASPVKAGKFIDEINPFTSPALFHAGIAGFWLFLSGLISGYFDNKVVFDKIPDRLRQVNWLKKYFGIERSERIIVYIENNLGSLAGNFFLGIFLGTTGTIGFILGWDIDIRHITFSSANFGLAFFTLWKYLSAKDILITILGLVGIGFMNFAVSFSLALFIAIKSRGAKIYNIPRLFRLLFIKFKSNPMAFIFPPKNAGDSEHG